MKTKNIITIVIVALIILITLGIIFISQKATNKTGSTNLNPIEKQEDLSTLIDEIYKGKEDVLPKLQTQFIEPTDTESVKGATGLDNGNDLQYIAISEPMMSSQAYSLVLVKVKDGVDANNIAKTMSEKIDTRKWICVSAEKLYATSSNDIVCLVMASEEWAKPVYEGFKALAGTVQEEYTKTEELPELPEEL